MVLTVFSFFLSQSFNLCLHFLSFSQERRQFIQPAQCIVSMQTSLLLVLYKMQRSFRIRTEPIACSATSMVRSPIRLLKHASFLEAHSHWEWQPVILATIYFSISIYIKDVLLLPSHLSNFRSHHFSGIHLSAKEFLSVPLGNGVGHEGSLPPSPSQLLS